MCNLLCIGLHVFLYNTIKWPYQPKHSPNMHCNCIKMRKKQRKQLQCKCLNIDKYLQKDLID